MVSEALTESSSSSRSELLDLSSRIERESERFEVEVEAIKEVSNSS